MRIGISKQNLWDQKGIVVSQNNCPQLYDILNERRNILARNGRHLIPRTEKFNIKHDYSNAVLVSNTSTLTNLMIDNKHDKPMLENVYRRKSGRIVKKPKQYIDEM